MQTPWMARQGDLLIERIHAIPTTTASLVERARDDGRLILAYGEVTGHSHQIADTIDAPSAAIYDDPSDPGAFFLRVASATGLVHDEHARIDLAPGEYRVTRQREFTDEMDTRLVAD